MADSTHHDTRKYLLYPLAIIMLTFLVQHILDFRFLFAGLEKRVFFIQQTSLVISVLGVILGCCGVFAKKKPLAFFGIILFGFGRLYSVTKMYFAGQYLSANIWLLLPSLFSIPILAAIFTLFPYRKYFFTDEECSTGILSLIGTGLLVSGILPTIRILLLDVQQGSFHFSPLIEPGITVLVGLGILGHERFFAIYGYLVVLIFQFNTMRLFLIRQGGASSAIHPLSENILFVVQMYLQNVVIFFMLLFIFRKILRKSRFSDYFNFSQTTSPGGAFYYENKTCSYCRKSIPLSSKAGDRCPHCGIQWSCEHKIKQK